ncbi:MAG: phage tail sheath C-terminal domain-containing protein, partial [Candidatus Nanopelagicaceae bacterium]
ELAIVLTNPLNKIAVGDFITETEDPIASFTHDGATETARTPGTYTPAADAGGASFSVSVAQGAEILDVTDPGNPVSFDPPQYEGGAVTVTLLTAGDGYSVGDTITLASGSIGGGSNITVTVSTIVDDETAVTAVKDWYLNTEIGSTGIKLSAIAPRPGTSEFASNRGLSHDEVHIAVIDTTGDISGTANTILERLTYLSKLSDATGAQGEKIYYKDVINEQSTQIFNGAHPAEVIDGVNWGQASTGLSGALGLVGLHTDALTGGLDDYTYSGAEISDAYDLFGDTEETEIDFVLMGGPMALESDTKIKANKVVAIAAARKDCVAFVSPHKGNQIGTGGALTAIQQRDNTIDFFSTITSTSYAVFDSGYKYFYDRFTDKYRWLACNGDVAGLCVSTSAALDDWYSPAGVNRGSLRNAVKLAYNPNKADRDELYQNRINPIVSFPGQGVTLFGDKTALASPSAFDRINVRRLFLNVEKRAGELAKQVLFEQNDETTRASFSSALNSYLNEVQARRGVTDFLVVCDESNNTPDVIDRNEFVAEIYIKPTRSINFITITFTATKTGVSFSEVVGR